MNVPRHETDIDRVLDGNSSTFTKELLADPLDVYNDITTRDTLLPDLEDYDFANDPATKV